MASNDDGGGVFLVRQTAPVALVRDASGNT